MNWRDPVNGYRKWLDDGDFAEYFIFNEITRNGDGMLLSMFPWKGDDGKLRMGPVWDYNWGSYQVGGGATGNLRWRSDQIWYRRLFSDPDFKQLYIDRWFAFRGAAMSNANMSAIIDAQAAEITGAKAMLNGVVSATDFTTRLKAMKTWLTQRGDWVDGNYIRPPVLSVTGGIVKTGDVVGLTALSGTIYRTLDGTDPRLPGGAISTSAVIDNAIPVHDDTKITARVNGAPQWSAPTVGVFVTDAVAATDTNLAVSEIHYHPIAPSAVEIAAGFVEPDDFEFVEVVNFSAQKVSLADVQFTRGDIGEGIGFRFNDGGIYSLGGGKRVVVVKNRAAFILRYGAGIPIAGEYSGRLDDSGDLVTLKAATGTVIASILYGDTCPWPVAADGSGYSLTFTAPGGDQTDPANWRTSIGLGGTPGNNDGNSFSGGEILDYALAPIKPMIWTVGGEIVVQYRRNPGSDGALVMVETSTDLMTWVSDFDSCVEEIRGSGGEVFLKARLSIAARRFIRLRAVQR